MYGKAIQILNYKNSVTSKKAMDEESCKRYHNNQPYFRTETLHLGSMPSLTFGHANDTSI